MVLQGPRVPQVLERLVLQVKLPAASVRDGCAPRGCTGIYMGRTSRASERVQSLDGLGDERAEVMFGSRQGQVTLDIHNVFTCACEFYVTT